MPSQGPLRIPVLMLENQLDTFKNLIQQKKQSNWSCSPCMCRPNAHMVLCLLREKLPKTKKIFPGNWVQFLTGYFLPQWLLMVDLCCVWKNKNLHHFFWVYPHFLLLPAEVPRHVSPWCQGGDPGREVSWGTHSHPFLSALWEHHIW